MREDVYGATLILKSLERDLNSSSSKHENDHTHGPCGHCVYPNAILAMLILLQKEGFEIYIWDIDRHNGNGTCEWITKFKNEKLNGIENVTLVNVYSKNISYLDTELKGDFVKNIDITYTTNKNLETELDRKLKQIDKKPKGKDTINIISLGFDVADVDNKGNWIKYRNSHNTRNRKRKAPEKLLDKSQKKSRTEPPEFSFAENYYDYFGKKFSNMKNTIHVLEGGYREAIEHCSKKYFSHFTKIIINENYNIFATDKKDKKIKENEHNELVEKGERINFIKKGIDAAKVRQTLVEIDNIDENEKRIEFIKTLMTTNETLGKFVKYYDTNEKGTSLLATLVGELMTVYNIDRKGHILDNVLSLYNIVNSRLPLLALRVVYVLANHLLENETNAKETILCLMRPPGHHSGPRYDFEYALSDINEFPVFDTLIRNKEHVDPEDQEKLDYLSEILGKLSYKYSDSKPIKYTVNGHPVTSEKYYLAPEASEHIHFYPKPIQRLSREKSRKLGEFPCWDWEKGKVVYRFGVIIDKDTIFMAQHKYISKQKIIADIIKNDVDYEQYVYFMLEIDDKKDETLKQCAIQ